MTHNIFFQKHNTHYEITDNVNIILSPEYYWVRIFEIPIESKKDALLSLPILFEDYIDTDGYKYHIIKLENNKYLGFAYDEEYIKSELQKSNVSLKKINAIYFAQNELRSFFEDGTSIILSIDGNNFMYQDGIVVKIPSAFVVENIISVNLNSIELSKNYFLVNNYSKYISNKMAFVISFLLLLISLGTFTKAFYINKENNLIPEKIENIRKQNDLPQTLFQTKSILDSMKKKESNYLDIRSVLENCINFKIASSGTLLSFELNKKELKATFSDIDANKLSTYFKSKYKNVDIKKSSENVVVEIRL